VLYITGRRAGVFNRLDDMNDPLLLRHAENAVKTHGITPDNVDEFVDGMMKRFV
jgi:hypothetical protein